MRLIDADKLYASIEQHLIDNDYDKPVHDILLELALASEVAITERDGIIMDYFKYQSNCLKDDIDCKFDKHTKKQVLKFVKDTASAYMLDSGKDFRDLES